jgi:hypothetical protein
MFLYPYSRLPNIITKAKINVIKCSYLTENNMIITPSGLFVS